MLWPTDLLYVKAHDQRLGILQQTHPSGDCFVDVQEQKAQLVITELASEKDITTSDLLV